MKHPILITGILMLLFLSGKIHGQKAELTVNVSHPKGGNASGSIVVTGNDSTYTESLENGSAYFILKDATSVMEVYENRGIKAYPVPLENGQLTIEIWDNKGGILNIFEVNGNTRKIIV